MCEVVEWEVVETAAILIFFSITTLVVLLVTRYWIGNLEKKRQTSDDLLAWLKSTNERLDDQSKTIVSTLNQSTKALNERLDNAARFISEVQKNIGEMSEIGHDMKELSEFLKSPKLRGNIGEQILKEILGQMLPKQSFHFQYAFKSGAIVDAAIKTVNGLVPVDAKFPMENFRKLTAGRDPEIRKTASKSFLSDVKKHLDAISKKYILTDEGTTDFALMYVPSEAVYYEIVNSPELFDYAQTKAVLPVSPMTFYAYLKTILMSLEGQRIETEAREILKIIRGIQKDYIEVQDNLGVLSKHLTNAYNQMHQVETRFMSLGQKVQGEMGLLKKI